MTHRIAGCRFTIVEREPQILAALDWELALQVQRHLQSKGVEMITGTSVEAYLPGPDGRTLGAVRTTA